MERLVYLTHTRTDVCFAVGLVSRVMHTTRNTIPIGFVTIGGNLVVASSICPTKQHHGGVKRILGYVVGTKYHGIWNLKTEKFTLKGYSDSDRQDHKTTDGKLHPENLHPEIVLY